MPSVLIILLTQYPGQDHPLHCGWCGALSVLLCSYNVLGGEEQQEQKGQVGRCVADELDERFTDEEAIATLGSDEVAKSKHWVEEADEHTGEELSCPMPPSPARKFIVPSRCQ